MDHVKQHEAQTIALKALGWLATNQELFPVFLSSTGAAVEDLAISAQDSVFLASVIEFILMDDAWVIAFCDAEGLAYEAPLHARGFLPGGEIWHFT